MAGGGMGKTKFTVRVEPEALETAKQYAEAHGTTVTSLVQEFFHSLGKIGDIPNETPVLNELAGSLNASASIDDYRAYLEEKYLGTPGKDE
jgi:hypothetical protein